MERFPRRAGVATLVARRSLTPRMIRVTLRCDTFRDDWPIRQPGEIITLQFGGEVALPVRDWKPWRNYTVRHHRREAAEIDVDVVLHEPRGPACAGAEELPLGAGVGFAGPRVDFAPRAGVDWLLLCGDESALPAIAAIIERAPAPHVFALVEVHDAAEELPMNGHIRWVHRDGAPAAATSHLADALRSLTLPAGPGQAWGAAESRVARDLRAVLREDHGLPKSHATARGYWLRHGDWLDDEG
jgi:NADPH-dependent ferric siderophore reductase